jgi:WhiB family redox-sensing transcriptional regulator
MSTGWMKQSACTGKTDLFFIKDRGKENASQRRVRERTALDICSRCHVILECRQYARDNNEQGIWGGETDEQRWQAGYLRNNSAIARTISARKYRQKKRAERKNNASASVLEQN